MRKCLLGSSADTLFFASVELVDDGKVDLIAMRTRGHSALNNLILGSVASGVLARSKVPVLLIR